MFEDTRSPKLKKDRQHNVQKDDNTMPKRTDNTMPKRTDSYSSKIDESDIKQLFYQLTENINKSSSVYILPQAFSFYCSYRLRFIEIIFKKNKKKQHNI
jgi:anion-transporting  ArsA/GET3 family ATPase